MKKSRIADVLWWVALAALFGAAIFIAFYNLGVIRVEPWDESRHGINAYEMLKNNNFIVSTYLYKTDYWNLKPPLSYWCIMLFYKLFGFNVFAFKLYSAVSFIIMLAITVLLTYKRYGKSVSLSSVFFMVSIPGLVYISHLVRFADADMLYSTIYLASFLCFINSDNNKKLFYLSGLLFGFAFLTKSYHSGTIIICSAVCLLVTKRFKDFKIKEYIIYCICAAAPILIWAIARMTQDGFEFLYNMVYIDVLSRSSRALEDNSGPFYYYFYHIGLIVVKPLLIALAAFIISKLFTKFKIEHKNDVISFLIWILLPAIMFSFVKTKLAWYMYPQILIMCVFFALAFCTLIKSKNKTMYVIAGVLAIPMIWSVKGNIVDAYTITGYDDQIFFVSNINDRVANKEKDLYVQLNDKNGKPRDEDLQEYALLSELYGDMLYHDGGVKGFIEDNDAEYLYTTVELYNANKDALSQFKVVNNNEQYYWISRN